ncbi:MAG: DUF2207 domain-containing protein [Patescibacteria group bacterium]|nr:DUF2207 domain-containing protein [Patescibacteria group bacterium]
MGKTFIKTLIFVGAFGLLLFAPKASQAKSWDISDWDSQIRVHEDGTITVRETRTFDFEGSFSWVETEIYKNRVEDIVDFQVFDEQNNLLSSPDVETADYSDRVWARLNFSATDQKKTWIFQYEVLGGVGFFEDHDEFYWNVLPMDREVSVDFVRAAVILPADAPNLADYPQTIYLGPQGSTQQSEDYEISDSRTIKFRGQLIGPAEGFTIVSSWPKGIVEDPGTLRIEARIGTREIEGAAIIVNGEKTDGQTPKAFQISDPTATREVITISISKFGYTSETKELTIEKGKTTSYSFALTETWWYRWGKFILAVLAVAVWLLPIFAFIYYYRRWKKLGQDPDEKKTIIAQYEPPQDMTPSEMGTVIDERVQLKDITPMIVDFAVRGWLTIQELKPKSRFSKKDYRLIRTNKTPEGLTEYERLMLEGLFHSKPEVDLSDLQMKFYHEIPGIKKSIYQAVADNGYFDLPPDKVRRQNAMKPLIILILGFVTMIFSFGLLFPILLVGIIGLIFALAMPKKTVKGAEAKWWIQGFKLYLITAERFRLGQMTPETFEKYLPYAMVLGVEKEWAKRFADIYKEPPNWYHPAGAYMGAFLITDFTRQLSGFTSQAGASLGSSPRSSGSSSSSGFSGGFSGGGGGGGGVSAG